MREGTQAGGAGEEEAGSQCMSLMWGSIPELWDHALSRRQTLRTVPPRRPYLFFFLKVLFIYSTDRETASERGNTSRGSGRGRSRLPA